MRLIAIISGLLLVGCASKPVAVAPNPVEQALITAPPTFKQNVPELNLEKFNGIKYRQRNNQICSSKQDFAKSLYLLQTLRHHLAIQRETIEAYQDYYDQIIDRSQLRESDLVVPPDVQMERK